MFLTTCLHSVFVLLILLCCALKLDLRWGEETKGVAAVEQHLLLPLAECIAEPLPMVELLLLQNNKLPRELNMFDSLPRVNRSKIFYPSIPSLFWSSVLPGHGSGPLRLQDPPSRVLCHAWCLESYIQTTKQVNRMSSLRLHNVPTTSEKKEIFISQRKYESVKK